MNTQSYMITSFADINLDGIKGILIDLDDTLYDYKANHERAMKIAKQVCQQEFDILPEQFEHYFNIGRQMVHNSLHGVASSHSRLLYFQKMYEQMFNKTNPSFSLKMEETYWSEFLSGMELTPMAERFMNSLVAKGIKSCVVTDLTCQIQMQKLIKLGLDKMITYLVSSEEAGIEKPSNIIFELALSKLDLKAEDVIMIGDNEEKDIKGAERMGIKSYLIKI